MSQIYRTSESIKLRKQEQNRMVNMTCIRVQQDWLVVCDGTDCLFDGMLTGSRERCAWIELDTAVWKKELDRIRTSKRLDQMKATTNQISGQKHKNHGFSPRFYQQSLTKWKCEASIDKSDWIQAPVVSGAMNLPSSDRMGSDQIGRRHQQIQVSEIGCESSSLVNQMELEAIQSRASLMIESNHKERAEWIGSEGSIDDRINQTIESINKPY